MNTCTVHWPRRDGYTVIELLVVLAALGLLLGIAAPRYARYVDNAREVALRHDLRQMREAIDKFYGDQARYPSGLSELVDKRYLRSVPADPMTQSTASWVLVAPSAAGDAAVPAGGVYDVRSGASGKALDGSLYATW